MNLACQYLQKQLSFLIPKQVLEKFRHAIEWKFKGSLNVQFFLNPKAKR